MGAVSTLPGVQRAGLATAALLAVACAREPLDAACPEAAPGDLVISELRGDQRVDDDPYGEWIELYNASDVAIDLAGLRLDVRKLDGSGGGTILVRRRDTFVAPGSYVVLGRVAEGAEPSHIDYGYADDFDDELFTSGAIDVSSCGELIDRVVYRSLTDFGTLALDGAIDPPSADANDDEAAFCVDDQLDDANPSAGVRGTPQAPNKACE